MAKKKAAPTAQAEAKTEPFVRPEPDFSKDKNVQARERAGKRSAANHAGKADAPATEPPVEMLASGGTVTLDDPTKPKPAKAASAPAFGGATGSLKLPGALTMAEGGIVAEAEKEVEAVSGAAPGEEPGGEPGETEPPAEAAQEAAAPEMEAGEAPAAQAEEEGMPPGPEAAGEEMGEAATPEEYQPPNGESHDDLIDQYHEALAFGDNEQAKELYKKLQEHRFAENTHRAKSEAQAQKEAQAFLSATQALIAKHPELGQDGLEADKVLAVSDVYRNNGMSAVQAIQQAVADLYPEEAAPGAEMPMGEAAAPEAGMPEEMPPAAPEAETPPEAEAAAPEAEAPPAAEEPMLPDMTARKEQKKSIPSMPTASARNEPTAEPEKPSRTSAIAAMKAKRGQV